MPGGCRIGDARAGIFAIEGEDVLLGDGAPVHVAGVGDAGPALDAGEKPLDAGPVARDAIGDAIDSSGRERLALPFPTDLDHHGNKILRSGKNEYIRVLGIDIPRKPFVGLARDLRRSERPAKSERPIARTGIIGERELRAKSGAAGTRRNRHCHRAGAGHWVGGKLFADPTDGPSAFGER